MVGASEQSQCMTWSEVLAAVGSFENIQTMLRSIAETVVSELRAKACSIALLSADKKSLLHTVSHGLTEDYLRKGTILAERSIPEALQGKPVAVLDATHDERVQYPEEAEKEGIVSILVVPVMLKEECLGVLRVYCNEPRHFTDEDVRFVSTAASMGAVALMNAVMSQYVQHDIDRFRQQLLALEWGR